MKPQPRSSYQAPHHSQQGTGPKVRAVFPLSYMHFPPFRTRTFPPFVRAFSPFPYAQFSPFRTRIFPPSVRARVPLPYSGLPPSHLVVPTLQSLSLPILPSLCPPSSDPSFLLPSIPFPPLPLFSSTHRSPLPPRDPPFPSHALHSLPLPLFSRFFCSHPSLLFSSLPKLLDTPLPLPPLLSPLSPYTEPPFFPSLHNLLPSFPSLTDPPSFLSSHFLSFPSSPLQPSLSAPHSSPLLPCLSAGPFAPARRSVSK
ncbi:unnamed protein product [Closterium sp. Naga37s-1]|nr:unnamed protein product [Closterium sp. Naga37s-1]